MGRFAHLEWNDERFLVGAFEYARREKMVRLLSGRRSRRASSPLPDPYLLTVRLYAAEIDCLGTCTGMG